MNREVEEFYGYQYLRIVLDPTVVPPSRKKTKVIDYLQTPVKTKHLPASQMSIRTLGFLTHST